MSKIDEKFIKKAKKLYGKEYFNKYIEDFRIYKNCYNLDEFILELQEIHQKIKNYKEGGATVLIEFSEIDDCDGIERDARVIISKEETDEEYEERMQCVAENIKKREKNEEKYRKQAEENEYKNYLKLKQKFENKKVNNEK